jgi:plastocyanin
VVGLSAFGVANAPGTPATLEVGMYGNAIYDTQDLSFRPPQITAHVGDTVRWTNQDVIVPHTATENHGLWDLAGNYGATPVNPAGVAPGSSVQRTFEAGTQLYYCRVHPVQMHGEIDVPVDLSVTKHVKKLKHHRKRIVFTIHVRWDATAPPSGLVFDVERARGTGAPTLWLNSTSWSSATFTTTKRGSTWHLRARLHRASDPAAATGWSPDAVITAH